jgi:DNA-directed RNA polymerase
MSFTTTQITLIENLFARGFDRHQILEKLELQKQVAIKATESDDVFKRSVFKRSVMCVSAYGSKLTSVRQNTVNELKNTTFLKNASKEEISLMSQDIFNKINEVMESSTAYKRYATSNLKKVLLKCDSIDYIAPLSKFPVRMKINRVEKVNIRYQIPYTRRIAGICLLEKTSEIDTRKTISSSVPSIIHSIDAGILMRTKDLFKGDFAGIHDSFGTHSNHIIKLKESIKDSLVELLNCDALSAIFTQMGIDEESPSFDTIDFEKLIRESKYFFN